MLQASLIHRACTRTTLVGTNDNFADLMSILQARLGQQNNILRRWNSSESSTKADTAAQNIPDPLHGSYHWIYERALSVATLGAVGAAFLVPGKSVDMALGVLLPLHSHVGFGAIITDYLPARKFPRIYPITRTLLYVATAGTLYGLYQYNTSDVGICEGVQTLWEAKSEDQKKQRA